MSRFATRPPLSTEQVKTLFIYLYVHSLIASTLSVREAESWGRLGK